MKDADRHCPNGKTLTDFFMMKDADRHCPNGKTLTDFGPESFWCRPRFHRPPIHSFVVFQGDSKVNSENAGNV